MVNQLNILIKIPECTDKIKCLMQWNAKQGELFCPKALDEMASYLNS